MHHFKYFVISIFTLVLLSGCNQLEFASRDTSHVNELIEQAVAQSDFQIDPKFRSQKLLLDLDGDGKLDLARVVKNTLNKKVGFEIIFGNGQPPRYLFAGKKLNGLDVDDLSVFQTYAIAPKHEKYIDLNVSMGENGDMPDPETVPEDELVYLEHDGIDIGMLESCGGGIIYMKDDQFHWIQSS